MFQFEEGKKNRQTRSIVYYPSALVNTTVCLEMDCKQCEGQSVAITTDDLIIKARLTHSKGQCESEK